jgi:hypothetical protein
MDFRYISSNFTRSLRTRGEAKTSSRGGILLALFGEAREITISDNNKPTARALISSERVDRLRLLRHLIAHGGAGDLSMRQQCFPSELNFALQMISKGERASAFRRNVKRFIDHSPS